MKRGHEMEKEYVNGKETQIWISTPKRHNKAILCTVAAAFILLLGIFLIGGYKLCLAAGILMVLLTILINFLMQKSITIANSIFYFDRGEMYMISLHKEDKELRAYLYGQMDEPPTLLEKPGALLLEMADKSVIWHINDIPSITELKSHPDNKRYKILFSFDLPGYAYDSIMEIKIQQKHFQRFESLIHALST